MKKLLLWSMFCLLIALPLLGYVHILNGSNHMKTIEVSKRKFIILDSVTAPLPPEAKAIKSMPSSLAPQQLPNANWKDPIVITKMPLRKQK